MSLRIYWQKSIFLTDYEAGLGYILPINRKTNLWKFIHRFSPIFTTANNSEVLELTSFWSQKGIKVYCIFFLINRWNTLWKKKMKVITIFWQLVEFIKQFGNSSDFYLQLVMSITFGLCHPKLSMQNTWTSTSISRTQKWQTNEKIHSI